jgi:hypothetical protein
MSTDKTARYVYRTRNYAIAILILNRKTCAMLESAVAVEYWHQRTTAGGTCSGRDANRNSKIVWKGEKKTEGKTRVRISWRTIGTVRSCASGAVKFSGSVAMLRWDTLLPVSQYNFLEREIFYSLAVYCDVTDGRPRNRISDKLEVEVCRLLDEAPCILVKGHGKFRGNRLLLEAVGSSETVAPILPDSCRLSLPVFSFI